MTAKTPTQNSLLQATDQGSSALGATIRRSVESPFAPLLASLEGLEKDFPADDGRAVRLGHVVEMLESVRHGVQALVDLIAPEDQHSATCSLEELARCAVLAVPSPVRAEVQLALEDGDTICTVDGPRFSRCLSYLVLANLPQGREAMLHVARDGDNAAFTLLVPANDSSTPEPTPQRDEFMQLVAERELIRLGGSFEFFQWSNGTVQFTAQLPITPTTEA